MIKHHVILHHRYRTIALSCSYHRVIALSLHVLSHHHHRINAPSLHRHRIMYHCFIGIALSHYRRKCRWYDDAIVDYMALSGFHNNLLLKLHFLFIMIYWAKWAHVIYYVFSQCVLN